ncbi:hypothetical protein HK098_002619 [Nowakowskiella sp. JEL0407]|nr:hypothetical protein HK098_002619 [Nowakowskiella sp. JEL0407]
MGGILTCFVSEVACCFGKTACSCLCKACGTRSSTATRVGYSLMLLFSAILSWGMLSKWASEKLEFITFAYLKIPCAEGQQCFGHLGVHRVLFATALFHLIFAALMWDVKSSRDWRGGIQNGFWAWKLGAWVLLIVLAFVIPNPFFFGWRQYIALPGAVIFLLIQIVLLIEFAHSASEGLLELWETTDDNRYIAFLLIVTCGALIGSLIMTILLYIWFASGSCHLNQFFITFNLIICFVASAMSILPRIQEENPKSGLAQAAMVTVYSTYLIASAISSEPTTEEDSVCNPLDKAGSTERTTVIVGAMLTFLAIAYSTSRAATSSMVSGSEERTGLLLGERGANATKIEDGYGDDENDKYPADDEKDGVQYNYTYFHIVFALAAMYLAMLITNWNTITVKEEFAIIGKSMSAVWVKVISSWVVMLLYVWTLIAPLVLPDRDWA